MAIHEANTLRRHTFASSEEALQFVQSGEYSLGTAFGKIEVDLSMIDDYCAYLVELANIYNQIVEYPTTPQISGTRQALKIKKLRAQSKSYREIGRELNIHFTQAGQMLTLNC